MSAEILDEIRSVLRRRKIQQKFPLFPETRVEAFVKRIQALAVSFAIVPPVFRLVPDPAMTRTLISPSPAKPIPSSRVIAIYCNWQWKTMRRDRNCAV